MEDFVHLHVHTEYSLLDGAVSSEDLAAQAKEYNMSAVAVTDHGVMFGAIKFYRQLKEAGIKPIIGCEVYVAKDHTARNHRQDELNHLVLLAENKQGYHNLLQLVSQSWLEGFYYKPRVDKELLSRYSEGLICLSGCLAGEISTLIQQRHFDKARQAVLDYKQIFGARNFFLELQDHGLQEEKVVNAKLAELSQELDVPMVATNDVHYLNQADAQLHDILLCIQTGEDVESEARMEFPNDQFYFKSPAEMKELFADYPGSIKNTVKIAKRCQLEFDFDQTLLPAYEVPAGETLASYLRQLAYKGAEEKYGEITPEVEARLEHELETINQMGFPAYFLIVRDFVEYAKKQDIIVGPGRGSAASSLVSYVLDITNIDPLEYDLLFERFLNPERVSMPDIDIDFCYERRDEVIDYVTKKYGQDRVAQIITFGTMAARGAIRDVGRVLGVDYDQVDQIAEAVPEEIGIGLEEALEKSDELQEMYQSDSQVEEILDYAAQLEGQPRHASTHAAGVVITKEELTNYTPLYQSDGEVTTQYPMDDLEALGLLKMDFLGLRNLTIIDKTIDRIAENRGEAIEVEAIPFDDAQVYQLLSTGHTLGVFQLESEGMRRLIARLEPEEIEDIVALLALYRPGPLGSGMVDDFIARRRGEEEVEYPHPDLKEILAPTYGVILYQEQVMQIVQQVAGYSLGQADILRRAMGKKKPELMKKHRQIFIEGNKEVPGAVNNGYSRELAEELFELIEYFSGYGFNKAHSASYAHVSYYTAYLKTHYPLEFMAAVMTNHIGNEDKIAQYIAEAERMNLPVLPPDVNSSQVGFTVVDDKIRFGLEGIKHVGDKAIEEIIAARQEEEFTGLIDFCYQVDLSKVTETVIESLIKAGALDFAAASRAQMLKGLSQIFAQARKQQKEQSDGQTSFSDLFSDEEEFMSSQLELPEVEEFDPKKLLALEKEVLGLYLSGHPLDQVLSTLQDQRTCAFKNLSAKKLQLTVGGIITFKREVMTKNQRQMAFLTVADETGEGEVVVFPDVYQSAEDLLAEDELVLVAGRSEQEGKIIADKITDLAGGQQQKTAAPSQANFASSTAVHLQLSEPAKEDLVQLKEIIAANQGSIPVYLHLIINQQRISIRLSNKYKVSWTDEFKLQLTELGIKYTYPED